MFPKSLQPTVPAFGSFEWAAAILLPGVPVAPVRQQVCVRCDVVIRDGALPAQREFCPPCFAQVVA